MEKNKIVDGVQYSIAAIIFKNDKTLMFKREGEEWETGWEFVKGAMHVGETEEQAVLRELDEESGVNIIIIGKIPKIYWAEKPYKGGLLKIRASIYCCEYISGEPRLGEREHTDFKWMDLEEAVRSVWVPDGGEMIRRTYEMYKSTKSK